MGTNYYCENTTSCDVYDGKTEMIPLHIGKSSGGWCFMLHVIPSLNLNSLEDWKKYWAENAEVAMIKDEYGNDIPLDEMLNTITDRHWTAWREEKYPTFHADNYSEPGPNGLTRYRLNAPGCVGHGEGTWDLIEGEFS